jgi:signal transduction histidine kinase
MLLIFAEIVFFTYSDIHSPFANFIMIMIILLFIVLFYRKAILDGLVGFGVSYFIIAILAYFLVTFYQSVLSKMNIPISTEVQIALFIYTPAWITYAFLYKLRKHIFNAAIFFKNLKHSLLFVILIDLSLIILDTLRIDWTIEGMEITFKFFIYLLAFIIFVSAAIFFAKVNNKSKEVETLNNALQEKITELKKLKHDYGSEISSLYGLYQLEKYDRMGEMLKGIVERYHTMSSSVLISQHSNPVISSVLQSAITAGINVITIDDAHYENLPFTDNELLKVVSNIVNNSIEVLKDTRNPTIKFKSYNTYDGVTITILNNGPEIPQSLRNKIFETGFSTKCKEAGERGYGLSIVSDIVNKYNGKLSIESNVEATQFKIQIPNRM